MASSLTAHAPALLAAGCADAAALCAAERCVRAALDGWAAAVAPGGAIDALSADAADGGGAGSAVLAAVGGAAGPPPAGAGWGAVCAWALGAPLDVWREALHGPFLAHSQRLLAAGLQDAVTAVRNALQVTRVVQGDTFEHGQVHSHVQK